jgi:acyl-CoA synthetase (AMP-forming)/AMP-acid ligase II
MNLVEPIFVQARNKPAEIALAAPGTEFHTVSYARLARCINNVCRRVISAGLSAGSRVAIFIDDPVFHGIVVLALMRLGIVTISGRNKDFAWRFGVDAVIADKPFQYAADRVILANLDWVEGGDQPLGAEFIHRAMPDEVCRIFLTSGTTGDEKAVAVTNRMFAERMARQHLHFGRALTFCARIFVDLGLTTSLGFQLLISTLSRGGAMFMPGEAQQTVSALPIYKVQGMIAPPSGVMNFLQAIEKRPQYECGFEAIWTGGSSVPATLAERARMRICANLTIAYGSTEATMVASMPAQFAAGVPGAVGYVFPGINVEIVDDSGTSLPAGKEGIVRISSRFGATEYLGDPEETARVFRNGWFHPGDLGYLTNDNMLVITGRSKTILNVGGEKLSPENLEELLSSHPSVAQSAVFTVPNEFGVDEVRALVVPRSYVNVEALRAYCATKVISKFVPSDIILVKEIPRNATGKIDRQKLPALAKSQSH